MRLYGAEIPFDRTRVQEGTGQYPGGPPRIDRYTCQCCGGHFDVTLDGCWNGTDPVAEPGLKPGPENDLLLKLRLHREFCTPEHPSLSELLRVQKELNGRGQ